MLSYCIINNYCLGCLRFDICRDEFIIRSNIAYYLWQIKFQLHFFLIVFQTICIKDKFGDKLFKTNIINIINIQINFVYIYLNLNKFINKYF